MDGIIDALIKLDLRFNDVVIFCLIFANLIYVVFMLISIRELVRFKRTRSMVDEGHLLQSQETPPVSIITPVENEEITIVEKINTLLHLHYPKFELIVVNDGSTDNTLKLLIKEFSLLRMDFLYTPAIKTKPIREIYRSPSFPGLTVIDKVHGGRGDSINSGINISRNEYFCVAQSDSLFSEDALIRSIYPFVRWKDKVAATGTMTRMINGSYVEGGRIIKHALPKPTLLIFQLIESARTFLLSRLAWNAFNSVIIIPGAFGVFRKDLVLDTGGYSPDTPGEDMDMTLKLHRLMRDTNKTKGILLLPDPVCWTEYPANRKDLSKEKNRSTTGLLKALWKHKAMFLNPGYGIAGVLCVPVLLFIEVIAPAAELLGYLTITAGLVSGIIKMDTALLFITITIVFGFLASACGILIEETLLGRYGSIKNIIKLILFAFLENIGYRQYSLLVKFKSLLKFIFSRKSVLELP